MCSLSCAVTIANPPDSCNAVSSPCVSCDLPVSTVSVLLQRPSDLPLFCPRSREKSGTGASNRSVWKAVEGCAFVELEFIGSSTVLAPERRRCLGTFETKERWPSLFERLCGFWRHPYIEQEPAALLEAGQHDNKARDLCAFSKVDIGDGVYGEKGLLKRLRLDANNSGFQFAGGLLKAPFTKEEVEGRRYTWMCSDCL
ncbi:uncharacterized protein [Dermacentor albipictus]|uniref:uncharacterized protein n=1 Tax=Dermacentor albipictus TaxID=60249 RepID=UPI0038FCC351